MHELSYNEMKWFAESYLNRDREFDIINIHKNETDCIGVAAKWPYKPNRFICTGRCK